MNELETNATISGLITFFQVIIPIGAAARIVACLGSAAISGDEDGSMKARIRNVLVFTVLAEIITEIIKLVQSYF